MARRMTYHERLLEYERKKRSLQMMGLSNAEYERRILEIARKLRI